jgi:histidyl-tRNA synthetase
VLLLIEERKNHITLPEQPPLYLIVPLEHSQHQTALLLADQLHAAQLCVDILFEEDSIKSKMRAANKMGTRMVLIIGSEEQETGMVTVKNMITGAQEKIPQVSLVAFLKQQ